VKENFWNLLSRPTFTLAPMEDVTDTVFREIVLSISDPGCLHVLFSEFISTDGLCHDVGGPKVRHRLQINDSERKLLIENNVRIVAQIWGTHPEKFYKATKLICEEGQFDGIDINMGCPVKKIVKQGGCSALIAMPDLAKEIVMAAKEASDIPISIKTRIGINKAITEEWIPRLLECHPALITVHGRTQKQQSEGMADWNEVKKAVELRNNISPETLIHGNGDLNSMEDGFIKVKEFGVDGVMIGRGIFQNPWFFSMTNADKTLEQKLNLLWKHTILFTETWGKGKNFATLKRFYKIYAQGFPGAHQLRAQLMESNSPEEVQKVKDAFIKSLKEETQS
jgi:nifR3 family TIM-barrel protein